MSKLYLEFFYRHSIPEMFLWGVLLTAFWTAPAFICCKSERRQAGWIRLNQILFVSIVAFIFYWTILNRTEGARDLSLMPFSFLAATTGRSERYRGAVANVLLFIPVGLTLPFVYHHRPILTAVLSALAFSILIELAQYIFALGLCETDDAIMNTLGTVIGTIPYLLVSRIKKPRE